MALKVLAVPTALIVVFAISSVIFNWFKGTTATSETKTNAILMGTAVAFILTGYLPGTIIYTISFLLASVGALVIYKGHNRAIEKLGALSGFFFSASAIKLIASEGFIATLGKAKLVGILSTVAPWALVLLGIGFITLLIKGKSRLSLQEQGNKLYEAILKQLSPRQAKRVEALKANTGTFKKFTISLRERLLMDYNEDRPARNLHPTFEKVVAYLMIRRISIVGEAMDSVSETLTFFDEHMKIVPKNNKIRNTFMAFLVQ